MKKTMIYILIGLVLVLTVSCASTTRVDDLEFNLSEKEIALNEDLENKAAKIEDLFAELDAATARIEELETVSIPSAEKSIAALKSIVPVGEQRLVELEQYLPLYYEAIEYIQQILPLQQQLVDTNQAMIDVFTSIGFSAEY